MMNLFCHGRCCRHLIGSMALLRGNVVTAAISCLFLILVACGDDDSDFATRPSDGSSSSVCEDCDDVSSSSGKEIATNSSSSRNDNQVECREQPLTGAHDRDAESCATRNDKSSSSSVKSSSSTKSSSSSEYTRVPCDVEKDENCFEDARDGQTYKTVKIGDQVWMAENLNFETDKSSCYSYSVEYCDKYGRLYTWAAAMDSAGTWSANSKGCGCCKYCSPTYPVRGVCPDGWHLPTLAEWNTLFTAVGDSSVAGKKLKSMSGWSGWISDGNGTDDFGFSALPVGYNDYGGGGGYRAYFWSSTEGYNASAHSIHLSYAYDYVILDLDIKDLRFSVRCLKD